MKKILIAFYDYCGMPRAWAGGPADQHAAVELEARRQLATYCKKKADVGDFDLADPEKFTMHVEDQIEGFNS